jgi:two-component system phosphate regulon response regulator OmpR
VQVNSPAAQIEADPAHPLHLQTVRGVGYRLVVD